MFQNLRTRIRRRVGASFTSGKVTQRDRSRRLAFESLEGRQMLAVVALQDLTVSSNTGEKPQSKIWEHADQWWTATPQSSGTWIHRLDGTSWTPHLQISTNSDTHTDVKADGDLAHILLFDGSSSQLASVEYDSVTNSYVAWSLRPNLVSVGLPGGIETATIDIDSTGRMWVAYDQSNDIEVRYSDGVYSSWSGPINIGTDISGDDISVITAMPNNTVGVLWSNQSSNRFQFRVHQDGAAPTAWSSTEIAAPQSAGSGMADDHVNVAVASDGTLYAAVKTSWGNPKIALLVRRPSGVWDPLYGIDSSGTRPIVLINEAADRLLVAYTSSDSGGDIRYKESSMSSISFGARQTLLSTGSLNNVTSTKQSFTDDVVLMASTGSNARGAIFSFDPIIINERPLANAGVDQTVSFGTAAVLDGTASDDGLPTPPGAITTTWSVVSGPGSVTFGNASAIDTTADFSTAGTYVLQLTADDGQLNDSDQMTVTVADGSVPVTMAFQDSLYPFTGYAGARDTKLRGSAATTNYGSSDDLEIDGSPDEAALLGWDVTAIPTGSIVTGVSLEFNVTNKTSHDYEFHALQRAWDEFSATWQQAASGTPWSAAGANGAGDHGSTVLGQFTASSKGLYTMDLNAAGVG
ncbi:MAG: DNRLRE domain-containing protein, partial [Aeoliella sp.]